MILALLAVVTGLYNPPTYACDGSTAVYTVNFQYVANTDVILTSTTAAGIVTTLTQGTDFTLSVSSTSSSATATLANPASKCPSGSQLKIRRNTSKTQPYSFRAQTSFNPALHELAYDREMLILQENAAGVAASGDISASSVLITGTTTAVNLGDLLSVVPIPAKAFGVNCDGTDEHLRIQQCTTTATQCTLPASPNCDSGTTTISVPPGHTLAGQGLRSTHLRHHGTGCGVSVDANDGVRLASLTLDSIGTTTGTMGLCLTNVSGPNLRGSAQDVMIVSDAPGGSPVSGTYGIYIHSTTGNSLYYYDLRHIITLGWDRGIESKGETGSGGANANFISAYSGNANAVGIFFDNFSGDNWVQGHCNGGGQVSLAQNCVTVGDGAHNAGGNFLMGVTSDSGTLGTAFSLPSPSGSSVVIAVNESGALDSFTADSTNFLMVNKQVGTASRQFYSPSGFFSGTNSFANDVFIGGARRDTGVIVKTNTDYTVGAHDRTIAVAGLTAPHVITLAAIAGQAVTIGDSDNSITGTNTLSIAPPGGGGKINGSASNLVLAVAGKSAKCEPLTATSLFFSCTISP